MQLKIKVGGMSCQNCVKHVTEALKEVQGVSEAAIDLDSGEVTLTLKGDAQALKPAIRLAVEEAGYDFIEA